MAHQRLSRYSGVSQRLQTQCSYRDWPLRQAIAVARSYARFRDQIQHNDLWVPASCLAQPEPLPLATADARYDMIAAEFPLVILKP